MDLAKRAVACKGWRWMPGMLAVHPNWRGFRVSHVGMTGMHGACRYASPLGGVEWAVVALPVPTSSDVLPDLSDDLTRLGLLALVREAWGDPYMTTDYWRGPRVWTCKSDEVHSMGACRRAPKGPTEAEALVAALEAAP